MSQGRTQIHESYLFIVRSDGRLAMLWENGQPEATFLPWFFDIQGNYRCRSALNSVATYISCE
jgi:hypothetical protein